jgi:hypothetical protein
MEGLKKKKFYVEDKDANANLSQSVDFGVEICRSR